MKLDKLRILEGTNLKGESNLIYIKIIEKRKEKIEKFIIDYEYICKVINIRGNLREVVYSSDGGEIWVTYEYDDTSIYILEHLITDDLKEKIINNALQVRKNQWEIELIRKAKQNNIPVIKIDNSSVQLGYGCKSCIVTKQQWINNKQIDLNNKEIIPIVSVTGTNGKTSTVRLIHELLLRLGYNSGLSSTGGVFIKNKIKTKGDTTGFYSARMVLTDKNINTAVLETARGGIIKKGLGYKYAKVGIITSLSNDHMNMSGVKSLEDLVKVKSLIIKEILDDGKLIINANKYLVDNINSSVSLVLFNYQRNLYIEQHIKNGGEAWYVENDYVVLMKDNQRKEIISVRDVPYTHNGLSTSNINNLLAALSAISTFHFNLKEICNAVKNIHCDLFTNPGRQNIFDINGYKLILDYGHNEEAYNEVFTLAKKIVINRLIGVISAPGDRTDEDIKRLGKIASKYCDEIIIKETFDRRGRNPLVISNLLRLGAREENENCVIKLIKDECEAIIDSIKKAKKGDVIVVFTHHIDIVIPAINKYLLKIGVKEIKGNVF